MKTTSKILFGSILTAGLLGGTVTAFAATSSTSATSPSSQTSAQHQSGFQPKAGGPRPLNLSTVAKTIGISQTTLKSDLKSGKSIAQIAKSKGVAEQTVITAVENSFKTQLDAKVKSGNLTAQQEKQRLSNFDSHAKQMIEHAGLGRPGGPGGKGGPGGPRPLNLSTVAKTLGISQTTLKSDLKSGKSIAQVAKSKGVAEQTVVTAVENSFKTQLDAKVKSGNLTAQQEKQRLSNFDSHAKQMIEHAGLGRPGGPCGKGAPGRPANASQPSTTASSNSTNSTPSANTQSGTSNQLGNATTT